MLSTERVHCQSEQTWMFKALLYLDGVQCTSKCILGRGSSIVGNLDAPTLAHGVVVEIDIGALIKPVVRGLVGWRGKVVMDICEERRQGHLALCWRHFADD